MRLTFSIATYAEAQEIADLRNAVAEHLTNRYGLGHWSSTASEKSVQLGISNTSKVLLARKGKQLVGTLRLAQKKPWAIDGNYFTSVRKRALYLVDMAVKPNEQKKGIGAL